MPAYKDKTTGTWCARFYYTDYTGIRKQKRKRGFRLKEEAKAYERNFLTNLSKSPSVPFSEVAAAYLEDHRINLKQISYETSKSRIKKWIEPTFNDQPINQIDAAAVRQWQNELSTKTGRTGKPLSDQYRHNLIVELSSIFSYAVKYYNLDKNPVTVAGNTGKKVKRCDYWTQEEFKKFLATFPEHDIYYTIFLTLYWTGARLGELMALTISDIHADRITINKTYHVINGKAVTTAPKTKKANRDIYITPELHNALERHIETLYHPKKSDRLFPVGDSSIARHFKMHSEAAELPPIRLHDIRHSHASLLINQGYDVLVVSERLGH